MSDLQLVLSSVGFSLIIAGLVLIAIAVVSFIFSAVKFRSVRGGGVVIIGPFPLIFGTDKESVKSLMIIALALVVALIAFFLVLSVALALLR